MNGQGLNPKDVLKTANMLRRSVYTLTRRLRAMRASHDVSLSKLSILGRLERAGRPMTASNLACLERLQPQSLTRIIADLDTRGLIRRKQNEVDRRQFLIEITENGHDLLVQDARRQNAWLAQAMTERLTDAERKLLSIVAELLDHLADEDADLVPNEKD